MLRDATVCSLDDLLVTYKLHPHFLSLSKYPDVKFNIYWIRNSVFLVKVGWMNSWFMYALYLGKVLLLRSQFIASLWLSLLPYTLNLKTFSHLCKVAVYYGSLSTTCFSCGLLYRSLPPHIIVGVFPFWNQPVMTSQKTAAFSWLYCNFFFFYSFTFYSSVIFFFQC